MDKTVETLETRISKVESDLDYMTQKLDCQLENVQKKDSTVNHDELQRKMKLIKSEHASLKKDVQAIQEMQKQFIGTFRSELLTVSDALQNLELNSGQSSEKAEVEKLIFDQLSGVLGIPKGRLDIPVPSSTTEDTSDPSDLSDSAPSASASSSNSSCAATVATGNKKQGKAKPESAVRSQEYCEISAEEYRSVSSLITQRLKREEVNKVYQQLWQFFKEEKNSGVLTPKDMNAMGLKVIGRSGEAKLQVLQALKLCKIGTKGEVTLL